MKNTGGVDRRKTTDRDNRGQGPNGRRKPWTYKNPMDVFDFAVERGSGGDVSVFNLWAELLDIPRWRGILTAAYPQPVDNPPADHDHARKPSLPKLPEAPFGSNQEGWVNRCLPDLRNRVRRLLAAATLDHPGAVERAPAASAADS